MKKFFSGLASLFLALLILEILSRAILTLRINQLASERHQEEWFAYSPELGWERKPNFNNIFTDYNRHFDENGFFFGDAAKLADTTRKKILFIGDSNTFGNDIPPESNFPSLVDTLLTDAVSINLGVPGHSSYQGKIILQRALKTFRPDLIVVSFNFNDRRYVVKSEDADGGEAFQRTYEAAVWKRRIELLEKSYAVRLVRSALRFAGVIADENEVKPARVNELLPRVSPNAYRENLSAMAEMARRGKIPLAFLLMRDNPYQANELSNAIAQLERTQLDSAIENLSAEARRHTMFSSLARLYLKSAYDQIGNRDKAVVAATEEKPFYSIHGGRAIRLDKQYNEIMIEVGRQFGAAVIDCAGELEKKPSVYYDFCHFDERGHRAVARFLAPKLDSILTKAKAISSAALK